MEGGLPARIVSLSSKSGKCPSQSRFLLGQSTDMKLQTRVVTTKTHSCQKATFTSPHLLHNGKEQLQHVVLTYGNGKVNVYIDCDHKLQKDLDGDLKKPKYANTLLFGNEKNQKYGWNGELYKVCMVGAVMLGPDSTNEVVLVFHRWPFGSVD